MFLTTVILFLSCIEIAYSSLSLHEFAQKAHDSSLCGTDYRAAPIQLPQQLNGENVQLLSTLNDDYNNVSGKIKHVRHFKANN